MNIITYNSRGCGGRIKKRDFRHLVSKYHLDMLALQETKREVLSAREVFAIWGNRDCEWVENNAVGRSGV